MIKDEWIGRVIQFPLREEIQSDGRIRRWARIAEMGNRVLRVILLEDGETVHNAFLYHLKKKGKRPRQSVPKVHHFGTLFLCQLVA